MGHNGDDYGYDKSSYRDEQWCKKVETELSKMTDVLNLKTGHASAYYATKEEELKAKILKDFIRMGIESGSMKPEMWTAPVLKLYLKKLGVKEETWVSQQLDPRRFKVHWFTPEEHKELDSLPAEERDKKVQEINRKLFTENDAQSAREKRELFGGILFVVSLSMTVIGASKSYSDYTSLNSTQLAFKTASDILAPDLTITGIGLFLLVAGIIIFFAESNKAAVRGVKGIFHR